MQKRHLYPGNLNSETSGDSEKSSIYCHPAHLSQLNQWAYQTAVHNMLYVLSGLMMDLNRVHQL